MLNVTKLIANVLNSDEFRREGSQRYNSLEIIRKAGPMGLSPEAYVAQGGQWKFVPWFLNRAEIRVACY